MKIISLVGVALAATLFTGCGAAFNKFVGTPNTQDEMLSMNEDVAMAKAFSKYLNKENQPYKDRTISVSTVKNGIITLSLWNFVKFTDGYDYRSINEGYYSKLTEHDALKTYIEVATSRGNKVKAYKGDLNFYLYGGFNGDVNTYKTGQNVIYKYDMSPSYIEFDKNNKVVSILTHTEDQYQELNNPRGRTSIDSMFYIFTGAKAQSRQSMLTSKRLEDSFLFDAN
jgi:hypothetical protein